MMQENPYAPPEAPVLREPRANRRQGQHPFADHSDKELKALKNQVGNLRAAQWFIGLFWFLSFLLMLLPPATNGPNFRLMMGFGCAWLTATLVLSWIRHPIGMVLGTISYALYTAGGFVNLFFGGFVAGALPLAIGVIGVKSFVGGRHLFQPDAPRYKDVKAEWKRRKKAAEG